MGKLTHIVKGPIASFRSADKANIESLKLHFLPKQEGSGDPSPINVRPITGWTGCNLFRAKKNLFDDTREDGYITDNGVIGIDGYNYHSKLIRVTPGLQYTYSLTTYHSSTSNKRVHGYDISGNWVRMIQKNTVSSAERHSFTFTVPNNVYYIRVQFYGNHEFSGDEDTEIQVELGEEASEYASYSGEIIPLSWSSHGVEYGGYIDPVKGKLVAEYKAHAFNGEENISNYSGTFTGGIRLANDTLDDCTGVGALTKCDKAVLESTTPSDISRLGIRIGGGAYKTYFYVPDSMFDGGATVDKFKQWLSENGLTIVAKLTTPIEYDIDPISLKTFLDYNNFWTDMNDDTEVEYAFADRLSERKLIMQPERRIIRWNQLQKDGNFTDLSNWEITQGYGTLTVSGNIATWTCTTQPTQFYHTGFRIKNGTGNSNFLSIPWNHKIIVMAMVRCSVSSRIRLYGLVGSNGNTYIYQYNYGNANLSANTWTKVCGFISNRPETPPASSDDVIIKRFRPTLHGTDGTISTIAVGTTLEMKNFMAFDLTQMFGLGNEPSTVEEFERICRINGIDLDIYQPYNLGSDKLMIMPM